MRRNQEEPDSPERVKDGTLSDAGPAEGTKGGAGGRITSPAKSQRQPHTQSEVPAKGSQELGADGEISGGDAGGSSESFGGSPGALTAPDAKCIALRVDALVLAFKLEIPPATQDEVRERQSIADIAGTAELRLGGLAFTLKRSRQRESFVFENSDARAKFDERASGGWRLEVVLRATYLATHELSAAIALAEKVAKGFGEVGGIRLRRFDLAADYINFPLTPDDMNRVATKRARTQNFRVDAKDTDEAVSEAVEPAGGAVEHRNAATEVTGITVAPGNPLMARIYDKSVEVNLAGREDKRLIEHGLWRLGGWDGEASVTRVEFQHRGVFLDEISMRDPADLEANLDAIWQHDVKWMRLVDPSTATRRARCKSDPRWEAVVATRFRHGGEAVERVRNRGGAKGEHVLGAILSRLGSTGQLKHIDLGVNEDGEPLDEQGFVAARTDAELAQVVTKEITARFDAAAVDVVALTITRRGPREAAFRFVTKNNATVARFGSADDVGRRAGKPASRARG